LIECPARRGPTARPSASGSGIWTSRARAGASSAGGSASPAVAIVTIASVRVAILESILARSVSSNLLLKQTVNF